MIKGFYSNMAEEANGQNTALLRGRGSRPHCLQSTSHRHASTSSSSTPPHTLHSSKADPSDLVSDFTHARTSTPTPTPASSYKGKLPLSPVMSADVEGWADPPRAAHTRQPRLTVFSGGTAFNSVAGKLQALTNQVAYVLPVSDDGGSTAEIVRVLGGPAVGDIRSRCLRLADTTDAESRAVVRLLHHRLNVDEAVARQEWELIVEGDHALWAGISDQYRHVIRRFLILFHNHVLQASLQTKLGSSARRFKFSNGSIGNFFFAGARLFFGSLDAAIFLFSRVARISEGAAVLPAILTDDIITLGAQCTDGTLIRGQNNISHPATSQAPSVVDKAAAQALPAAIKRVFYLSSEGTHQEHEVFPPVNPLVLSHIQRAEAVVYGMGSLYTSICPSLALEEVGEAIAARTCAKLLILNATHDRETSRSAQHADPMTASDIVCAIADTLNRMHAPRNNSLAHPPSAYINTIIAPDQGEVRLDHERLRQLGVERQHVVVCPTQRTGRGRLVYDVDALVTLVGELLGCSISKEQLQARTCADHNFLKL